MTPQEEQALMQAYVRQQMMQRQQPNLALPQQAVGNPQAFMQSPLGAGAASPQPAQPYQVPGLETQGELSGQQLGAGLKPMMKYPPNLQLMYRSQVPF